ncbi:MAG: hypothetical protein EBU66_20815, partial [Bacteroidetes bacterium]|nr:hypothetical protein [Bacteroidota bacterium]
MWLLGAASNGVSNIGYSSDGIRWNYASTSVNTLFGKVSGLASNGAMWVAGGNSPLFNAGCLAYSYNGIDWINAASGTNIFTSFAAGVTWNGVMWLAGGLGTSSIACSYDGINWTGISNPLSGCNNLAYNGAMWVAVGTNFTYAGGNSIAYSYDGINWTLSTSGSSIVLNGSNIVWNGAIWVVVGAFNSGGSGDLAAYSY